MLPTLSPQHAFEMFKNGEVRLIDIRESSEYAEKFIPGARLVPTHRTSLLFFSATRETAPPRPQNDWNAMPET